jgi:hypothetical protein
VSGVPQWSVLGPLSFLTYVNNILKNIESTIKLFSDDFIIYRKILSNNDLKNLQKNLNRLGEWVFEIEMIINAATSKDVFVTKARWTESLNYSLGDILIPKTNSCNYLGIILSSYKVGLIKSNTRSKSGSQFTWNVYF